MAVTCVKCLKTVSRCDESISCSRNSSHIFHVNCVEISVENLEKLKKSSGLQKWFCEDCMSSEPEYNLLGSDKYKLEMLKLAPEIGDLISKAIKESFQPFLESLKSEIFNLKMEVNNLKVENVKLVQSLKGKKKESYAQQLKKDNVPKSSNFEYNTNEPTDTKLSSQCKVNSENSKASASDLNKAEILIETLEVNNKIHQNTSLTPAVLESEFRPQSSVLTSRGGTAQTTVDINEGFTLVKHKKKTSKRNDKSILGTGNCTNITIKAAPRLKHLHVCKLHPDMQESISKTRE
ncbi:hypothetical protein WA026_008630 [Henosepilachna vigintioctopunctata]|uniref:PHD-type domain-containing protein n=1 Tax=Henosepilachna vigintioctopunctata TaxID=420089 RepID=A0AAW1UJ68_9CUCU